ncbi:MAG: hypothetical protein JXR76_23195 [Deltaproteobacteria bacterium]|nr:hypothetical protein [Deltaproteobacteria bacterium]
MIQTTIRSAMFKSSALIMPLLTAVSMSACKDDNGDDISVDTNVDTGTASDTDTGQSAVWSYMKVQEASAGIQLDLALGPNDLLGLTWYDNAPYTDGTCTEVPIDPPPRLRQSFYYGEKGNGAAAWTVDKVDSPLIKQNTTGLSLAYTSEGNPSIAFTGGVPEDQWCAGNDAVLAIRQGGEWQYETAGAESGDSNSGVIGSDEGMVVGLWPALTYSPSGEPAIVHKDAHFGGLQSIDNNKADAEFAMRRGGAWVHEYIDVNEGAGQPNALVFDGETPIAIYGIPVEATLNSRKGVWAARRAANGTWDEKVQLHEGAIYKEIAAAINPVTGALVVAFYSAKDKAVKVRRLTDMTQFAEPSAWTSEVTGNAEFDEGQYVSLAFTPQGKEVLAYHRCKKNSSTAASCDVNDEAAILAVRTDTTWKREVIAQSNLGSCGEYTSAVVDSTGTVHVAYRCTENDGGESFFKLFVASKEIEAQ